MKWVASIGHGLRVQRKCRADSEPAALDSVLTVFAKGTDSANYRDTWGIGREDEEDRLRAVKSDAQSLILLLHAQKLNELCCSKG